MSTIKVQVEVSKELYEAGQGLADFAAAMRLALADGWQVGSDMPVFMSSAMKSLVPALNGISDIDDEIAEDRAAAARAVALGLCDALFA
jgi:hypothetical protein